jgi:hypothetical protein
MNGTKGGPRWQPEPDSRNGKHHNEQTMRALEEAKQSASYMRRTPHYAQHATDIHIVQRLVLSTQHATSNNSVQHATRTIPAAALIAIQNTCTCANTTCIAQHPACRTQTASMQHTHTHTHTIPATWTIRRAQVLVPDNLQQPTYNMQH